MQIIQQKSSIFVVKYLSLRYVKLKIKVMKKYLFFFLLLLASFSCSSDNDDDVKNDSKIVGHWVSFAFDTGDGFWSGAIIPHYWIFKSDNTYESDYANYKKGTYTFNGNVLTLDGGFGEIVTFSEDGQQMEWGKWRYKRQ